jgi:cyclic beta-1,2-glucan synthetase
LQDACGIVWNKPELLRRQILRCCAVQFIEGDVLHWWHRLPHSAGGLRGVRTRCSDDMLWLPYALAHYLREIPNDGAILHLQVAYLDGESLRSDEDERYFMPAVSNKKESIFNHALRAVKICMSRTGAHGLPLFGNGDWNDSFNEVGTKGRGESVWLGMFLAMTLDMFAPVCEKMGDTAFAEKARAQAASLRGIIDQNCWEGDHYLRGWYDDGTPLGVNGAHACAIDSLTQSFAVFAGIGDKNRRQTALEAAYHALVDKEHRMIKLYAPPFDHAAVLERHPGYAAAYPPGIRENGGQYTHSAVWLAMAFAHDGQKERARELLRLINPAEICRSKEAAERYGGEPYALAGDVSAAQGIEGRAGWTLYTGSAAWFLQALRLID